VRGFLQLVRVELWVRWLPSMREEQRLLRSPRSNVHRLISKDLPEGIVLAGPEALEAIVSAAHMELIPADAENKLHHRKLYLVLDLDETLVYSQRMDPAATPVGTKIFVRGQPCDMVLRPGLQHFLQMAASNYIVFLYTMGDEDYTQAVLRVIDPDTKYFRGGICCWRQSESRLRKSLRRVICDRRMALVVDDSIDVWAEDLSNLCLTRRFIGDKLDDGLQLLSGQLSSLHRAFFADAPVEGWSFDVAAAGSPRAAPSVQAVLREQRGGLLAGCTIALTGVVTDQREESLEQQPLCALIRHYGGELTLSVDAATHLVARRKDGWQKSAKIIRALQRQQAGATGFYAVWDHWLLDTLSTWQKQTEESYAIRLDDARGESPPPPSVFSQQLAGITRAHVASADFENAAALNTSGEIIGDTDVPPFKRPRPDDTAEISSSVP